MNSRIVGLASVTLALLPGQELVAQKHAELMKVLGDTNFAEGWIYEDIDAGYAAAKKSGKPLLVAFR